MSRKINEKSFQTEKLSHCDLDERALDALKEFPVEGALAVLKQFLESNLVRTSQRDIWALQNVSHCHSQEHVSNKSAYLCGVMKTYRQKTRAGASSSSNGTASSSSHQGPDEEKIKAILDRTGYSLDVTTGQRKYGGPPPGWDGASPGNGCEVRNQPRASLSPLTPFSLTGVLWKDSQRHLRGWTNSPFREMR